jgi:hypothetical protein
MTILCAPSWTRLAGAASRAAALSLLLLGLACERGEAGARADTAPALVCPPGASVQRVEFAEERGGGFAERCMLPDGVSRHGPSREWDAEGRRRGITNWWQGARHGQTTFWHANGQKSNQAQHYRWQAVGRWLAWDEQGKVIDDHDFGAADPSVGAWPKPELGAPPDELGMTSGAPAPGSAGASPGAAETPTSAPPTDAPDAPPQLPRR